MTRRNRIIVASAALAILLLTAPATISAKSEASAQRTVNLDDATYAEKLQAVKDGLAGHGSAAGSASSTYQSIKDKLTGNTFDTSAARETLIAKLQPTLFERVQQKLTGHPTSAERISGAVNDVASEYGVDASTLQSYAKSWGLTADNLLGKSQDVKNALLSKTEPTLLEKVRQKLTGHPTSAERVTGAINDVAAEYGVDPASLKASAANWGLSAENLANKAQDVKDALLSKTEPTLVEKLRQRVTGHPTNSERATGAISDLSKEYGIHPDQLRNLASKHSIELPSMPSLSRGSSASDAADAASEKAEGLWSRLSTRFTGTKVGELLGALSPEEREARLRKVRVQNEAHDALDEALDKLYSAHGDKKIQKVDVNLKERSKSFGDRLSELVGHDDHDTSSDSGSSIGDTLSSYKNRILGGSLTKEQLEKEVGADPTLFEKIQRAVTGHPTDAERAAGAAKNAVGGSSMSDTISSYYDSIKNRASAATPSTSTSGGITDTLSSYKDRILGGSLTKAQLEKEVGADPTLLEKIQRAVTGHPTDAERAAGAAKNAVGGSSISDTISSYYDSIKNRASAATPSTSTSGGIADTLSSYKDRILGGSLTKAQLEKEVGADPTLLEKIQRAVTGHPTDAERAAGAAKNAMGGGSISDTVSSYYDSITNKAAGLTGSVQEEVEPSLLEKIQQKLTGHPTAAERAAGAASNTADKYGVKDTLSATTERLKGAAVDAQNRASEAADPSMLEKIQQKVTGHPTASERAGGAAQNLKDAALNTGVGARAAEALGVKEPSLTDRIKSSLGFREPTLAEKLTAAAEDLKARAGAATGTSSSTSTKLQQAAQDLMDRAKSLTGAHEDTYADKLKETLADLQAKVKSATGAKDPTLAERLQATYDSLSGSAKEKMGHTEPSLTDRIKGAFSGSDQVVVDKQKLKDAEAAVKAAKKTAKDL